MTSFPSVFFLVCLGVFRSSAASTNTNNKKRLVQGFSCLKYFFFACCTVIGPQITCTWRPSVRWWLLHHNIQSWTSLAVFLAHSRAQYCKRTRLLALQTLTKIRFFLFCFSFFLFNDLPHHFCWVKGTSACGNDDLCNLPLFKILVKVGALNENSNRNQLFYLVQLGRALWGRRIRPQFVGHFVQRMWRATLCFATVSQ